MEQDDALVRRAQQGERAAFEELVRRTSRLVYSRLYLEVGDVHQTEDLVQETFLRAFRSIGELADAPRFRGWLTSIAQSVAIDHFRRSSRKKRLPQPIPERTPGPETEQAETCERVRKLLLSLPEEYRHPLTLRYIDGADYDAITMQLGLTNGSLRGLLHRGLKLLRRAMTEGSHESPRP